MQMKSRKLEKKQIEKKKKIGWILQKAKKKKETT